MMFKIVVFSAIWYYTSSINAVATQHLVQNALSKIENVVSREELMIVLTTCQLLAAVVMALPIYFATQQFNKSELSTASKEEEKPNITKKKRFLIIGFFHSAGSLFTNIGFAYGSASVVQIIKLLEPIETLFLTVLYERSFHVVTPRKTTSTLVTILGTAMLLSQKNKSAAVNIFSVPFALLSGLMLSCRNVTVKHTQ